MESVSITRSDTLPDCCIVCGNDGTTKLRLKFAPKDEVSLVAVVLVPRLFRRLRRIFPTIAWTLPFCEAHARTPRLCKRLQLPLILLGLGILAAGGWSLMANHHTWPFVASLIVGAIVIALAHPMSIHTVRVTQHTLQCIANDRFAAAYVERNGVLPSPASNNASFFPAVQDETDEPPEFPTFQ